MKYSLFLAIVACILSASAAIAPLKADKVYTQVISYVRSIMADLPILRGGLCFEIFIPLINSIADDARELSELCISDANSRREILLRKGRAEIMAEVKKIQDSLTNCSANSNHLEYFQCLMDTVDEDKRILDMIAKRSAELIKEHAEQSDVINKDENDCLEQIVQEAKQKSDQAFLDLKECMKLGRWPTAHGTTTAPDRPRERGGP